MNKVQPSLFQYTERIVYCFRGIIFGISFKGKEAKRNKKSNEYRKIFFNIGHNKQYINQR